MSLMPFIQDCACCVRFFLAVSLHPTVPYSVHGDWRCALTGAKQLCFLGHVAGWWREGGCGIKKRATSKDIGSVRPRRRIWCHAVVALNQVVNCRHQQKNIVSGYVFFKWGPFHCWCLISPGDGLLKEQCDLSPRPISPDSYSRSADGQGVASSKGTRADILPWCHPVDSIVKLFCEHGKHHMDPNGTVSHQTWTVDIKTLFIRRSFRWLFKYIRWLK